MNTRSIAPVSLSGTLDEKLRAIAAAGFEEVEILRPTSSPSTARRAMSAISAAN